MKDVTFCINKECKERKDCFRAEENYSGTNVVNSYAMFNCSKTYEPIPCWVCGSDMHHINDVHIGTIQGHVFKCIKCSESVLAPYNTPFLQESKV